MDRCFPAAQIPCSTCEGQGTITSEHAQRIKIGELIIKERQLRDVSTREDARRLHARPIDMSDIERGNILQAAAAKTLYVHRLNEVYAQNLISAENLAVAIGDLHS